jgi:hypothetical protein
MIALSDNAGDSKDFGSKRTSGYQDTRGPSSCLNQTQVMTAVAEEVRTEIASCGIVGLLDRRRSY